MTKGLVRGVVLELRCQIQIRDPWPEGGTLRLRPLSLLSNYLLGDPLRFALGGIQDAVQFGQYLFG